MAEEKDDTLLAPGEGEVTWTPAQERALADGWNPDKDEMDNPDDWVDAKAFNFRGELMGRISQQGRKLSALEADNATLGKLVAKGNENTRKMVEEAYKKAVRDLKAERREAIRAGDHDSADAIDEQVDELKEAHDEMQSAPATDKSPSPQVGQAPDTTGWTPQQHAWYGMVTTSDWLQNDPVVFQQTLKFADELLTKTPNLAVGDFIGKVNTYGKKLTGGTRAPGLGPDDGQGGERVPRKRAGSKFTKSDLSDMEAALGQSFVEDKTFKSLDEYATLLGKDGNLEKQQR